MAYYATYMPNELGELQKVVINAGVGFVLPFYGETAPPGTLACDGSEISRAAYDELFQVFGTKAGAGDGVSTFNLPDLRGMFIRGTGGNAAALGVAQGDAIREINGYLILRGAGMDGNNADGIIIAAGGAFSSQQAYIAEDISSMQQQDPGATGTAQRTDISASHSGVPTAAENRPVNIALLWCIIYE